MVAILVTLPVSGGHVNPSVTVAFAICNRMKRNKVFHYLTAQYLGSFLAQCMVWVLYHQHIDDYDGGVRSAYGEANSTGKIFTTFPPPTATLTTCIIDQIFGGFLLLIGVCAIIDQRGMKIPIYLQPFIISVFIAGYGTSLGYNAGGINPGEYLDHSQMIHFIPSLSLRESQPATWLPVSSQCLSDTDGRRSIRSAATTGTLWESWLHTWVPYWES